MKSVPLAFAALTLLVSPAAFASDGDEPLGAEYCRPAGGIVEAITKFDSLKPKKRDTVGPDMILAFTLDSGEAMPERVELRDGDRVFPLEFDDQLESVGFIDQLRQVSEEASLCMVDPARADRTRKNRGFAVAMNMGVRFMDTPGIHSMEQIEDGLKDGRSHYKKMAGAMGFLVPKFDYIAVSGDDENNPPRVWATAAGTDLGEPTAEIYAGARMIALETLENMNADGVRIEGIPYQMSPSPDAKTVAKFTGDDEGEDDATKDETAQTEAAVDDTSTD